MKRMLSLILVLAMVLSIVPATAVAAEGPGGPEATGYYHAHGQDLIDPEGNVCLIKGISFGNVIFGNPSHYEDGPIDDHDENSYIEIAQMGLDHVRFEMNYGLFEDDNNPLVTVDANGVFVYHPDRIKESGFEWIDMNLQWAKAAGVNILLQIELPQGGYQASTDVMAPGPTYEIANGGKNLWIDMQADGTPDRNGENYKLLQERLTYMWQLIAARYANEPAVVGYGLLNEPVVPQVKVNGEPNAEATRAQLRDLYQHIVDAIRTVDENHAIFTQCLIMWFDPDNYNSTDWNLMDLDETQVLLDDDNIVYQFHFFEPFEYTHQGADWMPQYKDMVVSYPSDNLAIRDWGSKGLSGANTGQCENGWTYYETDWVTSGTIYGTAYNCAQPQVNLANLGSGDVWFDDIIVKRKDSQENETVLYSYSFDGGLGNFANSWFQNGGTYEWDAEVGRTGSGAIHAASSISGQWDNGNSWDNFYLDPNYTYQISGWVKGGNGSQFPQFSYLYADKVQPMDRSYVESKLQQYAKFGEDNNVPLFSGSWGFYYTCYTRGGEEYFKDVTELYEEYNISSNYHSYHDSTFGLYLSESWQPREERNEPLYNCLCKYYGKVEPTPTPDPEPEPDPEPDPDPAPEFTSAVMQDGAIDVRIDGICEGLVMAAVYAPDGKLMTILSMQVTPAFIAALNPVVHLDGVPELENGCVVKVFFVDGEGALQCAPTDDLNKTE